MTALPSSIKTGLIIWKAVSANVDGPDQDRDPDITPLPNLTVTLTSSIPRAVTTNPVPTTIFMRPITGKTNAEGVLVGLDAQPGIRVIATDNDSLSPTDFTYSVTISGLGSPINFNIAVPSGSTIDLSTVVPLESSKGTVTAPGGGISPVELEQAIDAYFNANPVIGNFATTEYVDEAIQNFGGVIQVNHGDLPGVARPDAGVVYWRGSIEPSNWNPETDIWLEVGTVNLVGPFDDFATPFRALSLRRLLSTYSGPAVKVRVGTEEQDIGFTASGDLDLLGLETFVDGNDAFVSVWYDQSPSARHLTQSEEDRQPKLQIISGKPAIIFDGVDDLIHGSPGLYAAGTASLAVVMQSNANDRPNATFVSESSTHTNSGNWRVFRGSSANWNVQATDNFGTSLWANTASDSGLFDLGPHQGMYIEASSSINTWRDGVPAHIDLVANRTGTLEPERFVIGAHWGSSISNLYSGQIQELIAWTSDRSSDRVSISSAQKIYWGTP